MVLNTPYMANSLFSPSEANLRHKGTGWRRTKSAAANPILVCFISSSPLSVYRCCWEDCHQSFIQVFLIPYFLIFLINQTCGRSADHNHVQCFVCFRYWFIIIEWFEFYFGSSKVKICVNPILALLGFFSDYYLEDLINIFFCCNPLIRLKLV